MNYPSLDPGDPVPQQAELARLRSLHERAVDDLRATGVMLDEALLMLAEISAESIASGSGPCEDIVELHGRATRLQRRVRAGVSSVSEHTAHDCRQCGRNLKSEGPCGAVECR